MNLKIKKKMTFFQYEVQCRILVKRTEKVLEYRQDNGVSFPHERLFLRRIIL